ncbi:MAG: hypothetical protein GQ565_10785 [Candidatus Aegiribacteria sp.]|nr:hypothetical protein [Candidatus Aegiribacteria sp.]
MKVGFDATNILGHSGIRTYTRELVRALAIEFPDDEFLLYTLFNSSKKGKLKEIFGEYQNVSIIGGLPHPRMLGDNLRWLTVIASSIAWRLIERKLDIVHLTDPYGTTALPGSFIATINDIFPITLSQYRNSYLQSLYPEVLIRQNYSHGSLQKLNETERLSGGISPPATLLMLKSIRT